MFYQVPQMATMCCQYHMHLLHLNSCMLSLCDLRKMLLVNLLRMQLNLCLHCPKQLDKSSKSPFPSIFRECLMKQKTLTIIITVIVMATATAMLPMVMIMLMQLVLWMHTGLVTLGAVDMFLPLLMDWVKVRDQIQVRRYPHMVSYAAVEILFVLQDFSIKL